MKELDTINNPVKIEIQAEQQEKKEIKFIGNQRKIPGLTLFEYNKKTKELRIAEYSKTTYNLTGINQKSDNLIKRNKLIINEGCIYIQALNEKNARKKANKY